MPDEFGNFKGQGWSQKRSDAWERVFGRPAPEPGYLVVSPAVKAAVDAHELRRCAESARENQNRDRQPPPA